MTDGRLFVVAYHCKGCSGGLDILGMSDKDLRPGDTIICTCGASCIVEDLSGVSPDADA